jgi:hypothetical protein
MALPKWITPAGNLGIVPELDYYQFPLDAYDASGGTLVFSRVSGRLPPGIQVVTTGKLQGIPVSELGGDKNVEYRFTIRVTNTTTNAVADRTFNLTVTNVAPPVIIPRNVYLGLYLDGTVVNQQLEAIESTPGATLTWRVKSGETPPGLSLSTSGLLNGYVEPIQDPAPGTQDGWDATAWNYLGWDFPLRAISKTFTFTVEVFDGVNYDLSTYRLQVYPRSSLTADNDSLPVDTSTLTTGVGLSIDYGSLHNPIITTVQSDLVPARQGSYFSFNVDAIDLDNDVLQYSVPVIASGAFDEQYLIGNSIPYVAATPINGNLFAGSWPDAQYTILPENTVSTSTVDLSTPNLLPGDLIKVSDSTNFWREATVNNHSRLRLFGNTILTGNVGDSITQTSQLGSTANIIAIGATTGTITFTGNVINANVGDYITQPDSGANATITSAAISTYTAVVTFNSGTFTIGSGNIQVNGSNVGITAVYPTDVSCYTDLDVIYTGSVFTTNSNAYPLVFNGVSTDQYPVSVVSVGVSLGDLADEGTVGFDEGKFDQGQLALPAGLSIDLGSGWITGQLPSQTVNEVTYDFEVVVYKRDDTSYSDSKLYTLTVLGDLNNKINWITASDLGTIENGKISDIVLEAVSTKDKPLFYKLSANGSHRLPQGLIVQSSGQISGRVSFEIFSLDVSTTTIDGSGTTFDNTYTFTVTASDYGQTVSADQTFTMRVVVRNTKPYEDLYLKAFLSMPQRLMFNTLMNNTSVFPPASIYRGNDPFFGLAKEVKTLFLPGLDASTLSDYITAANTNHFTKRLQFGDVKTAVALDSNFNVKYEVVYVEIKDENTSASGAPANTINLANVIDVPYYDQDGNSYNVVYPNAFDNMKSAMVNALGYANKGALPDWMTSKQPNGRVLGFTRAVVLAYTTPGESGKIAYRLTAQNFNFNQLDFTVDRYELDNSYSNNYDTSVGAFVTASETTFDRYPALSSTFVAQGTVDYASPTAFDSINKHTVSYIKNTLGGIDGYKNFKDGDTLVFAEQEFFLGQNDIGDYNQGWNNVTSTWDGDKWDDSINTVTTSDDLGWDAANYVPGYNEYLLGTAYVDGSAGFPTTPANGDLFTYSDTLYVYMESVLRWRVVNQRAGIWQINIGSDDLVTLTLISAIGFNDKVYVRHGFTYGGTNIYFDPTVKAGNLLPNYSVIPQQIRTTYTTFDGNGTRFFSNRDSYTVPGSNDKYIKFPKTGVFT